MVTAMIPVRIPLGGAPSTAGNRDLMAIERVKRHDDALVAYSRKDVRAMWDIGLD
jgi:hypothetical protein